MLGWAARTGAAAVAGPNDPYDDQFDDIAWIRELGRTYHRGNAEFFLHASVVDGKRMEWFYYLDAPWRPLPDIPDRWPDPMPGRARVALWDLHWTPVSDRLRELVSGHRTLVHDRRFVAVVLDDPVPVFEAYRRRSEPAGLLHRWLVDAVHPPVRWIPDPMGEALRALFEPAEPPVRVVGFGGPGGTAYQWHCPPGFRLVGLDVAASGTRSGEEAVVASVRPLCARPFTDDAADPLEGPWFGAPAVGGRPRPAERLACSDGGPVTGVAGRSGDLVDRVRLICGRDGREEATRAVGGLGGFGYLARCPGGTAAGGLAVAGGGLIDRVGLSCVADPSPPEGGGTATGSSPATPTSASTR
jgi:hypothetical protein